MGDRTRKLLDKLGKWGVLLYVWYGTESVRAKKVAGAIAVGVH